MLSPPLFAARASLRPTSVGVGTFSPELPETATCAQLCSRRQVLAAGGAASKCCRAERAGRTAGVRHKRRNGLTARVQQSANISADMVKAGQPGGVQEVSV